MAKSSGAMMPGFSKLEKELNPRCPPQEPPDGEPCEFLSYRSKLLTVRVVSTGKTMYSHAPTMPDNLPVGAIVVLSPWIKLNEPRKVKLATPLEIIRIRKRLKR